MTAPTASGVPVTVRQVKAQPITIDGPAASGKSSVARRVAEALGVPYVSSGLLYRAATHLAGAAEVPLGDEAAIVTLLEGLDVRLETPVGAPNRVTVGGAALDNALLHSTAVDAGVSEVARHPRVRRWVDARLRDLGGRFVVEGRDMGTVVFPEAAHKVYLEAPVAVRAARRVGERGADLEAVAEALRLRDARDAAQLRPAADATHLETGGLTLTEVVAEVLRLVTAR